MCKGPAPYYWGGTWLGATANCSDKELAGKIMKGLCADTEVMTKMSGETLDYVNNKANENFAKAQSICASGRDARAAELAAEYLGEITPDASCYAESLKLMRDMGVVLDKDKEYKQKMEAQEKAREHESTMSSIEAMKQIALSYQARELQRGKLIL